MSNEAPRARLIGTWKLVSVINEDVASGAKTATATVKTVYGGKKRKQTVKLLEQSGKWKLSALQ